MRWPWVVAGIVGLVVGSALGWQVRDWGWRWGTAAEWTTGLFTGAALVLTARALGLQRQELAHQREELTQQRFERERAQAEGVAAWSSPWLGTARTEWQPAQQPKFTRWVAPTAIRAFYWNRSPLVIYDAWLVIHQPDGLESVPIGTVPPMQNQESKTVEAHVEEGPVEALARVQVGVEFYDSAGIRWRRHPNGRLERLERPVAPSYQRAVFEQAGVNVAICEASDWEPGKLSDWRPRDAPLWKVHRDYLEKLGLLGVAGE